jgi:glycerol kinase
VGKYVLALDQGTTSSRAILFDHAGHNAGVASRELNQIYPRPGWVEHDPTEIWRTQLKTARDVMDSVGVEPGDIEALGITNQRETTIMWDRSNGCPVGNAIVWQCRRTAGCCEDLKGCRRGEGDSGEDRTCSGCVLLGHQDQVDPR